MNELSQPNSYGLFHPHLGKAQWIRAVDVVLIGPLMVAGGVSLTRSRPLWGVLLGALGIGTVLFNARNWYVVHQHQRGADAPIPTQTP